MLLVSLANRGINLWCVEKQIHGLVQGQATYVSDPGTLNLLNVIYSQATPVTGIDSSTATSYTTALSSATTVVRIGVKFNAVTASDTLTLAYSTDGASYTTILTKTRTDWTTGTWYWFDIPTTASKLYYRASMGSAATWSNFYLAQTIYDLPVTQWNRDTYTVINDKTKQGRPVTNFYLEKLLTPQATLWPVPNNSTDQVCFYVHRQIQDIGTLTQQIEIPQRWVESITWQCAVRVAFEVAGVDPARRAEVITMSERYLMEAESDETDNAPIYLAPNIQCYTR